MNKYGTEPNGGEEADEEDFVHCNVMSFIFNIYTTCAAGEAIIKLKLGLLMNEIRGILLKTKITKLKGEGGAGVFSLILDGLI